MPKASKEPGHPAPVDAVMTGEVRKENRERLPIGIAPVVTVRVAAMASRRRLGIGLRLRARIGFGGGVVGFRRDRGPRHACGRGITGSSGRRRGTRGWRRRGVFSLGGEACGGDQQCCGEGRREMPFHMRHPNMLRWSVRFGVSSEHVRFGKPLHSLRERSPTGPDHAPVLPGRYPKARACVISFA